MYVIVHENQIERVMTIRVQTDSLVVERRTLDLNSPGSNPTVAV